MEMNGHSSVAGGKPEWYFPWSPLSRTLSTNFLQVRGHISFLNSILPPQWTSLLVLSKHYLLFYLTGFTEMKKATVLASFMST